MLKIYPSTWLCLHYFIHFLTQATEGGFALHSWWSQRLCREDGFAEKEEDKESALKRCLARQNLNFVIAERHKMFFAFYPNIPVYHVKKWISGSAGATGDRIETSHLHSFNHFLVIIVVMLWCLHIQNLVHMHVFHYVKKSKGVSPSVQKCGLFFKACILTPALETVGEWVDA